jgi:hypothetical protein
MTLPTINPLPTPQALIAKDGGVTTTFYQWLQSITQGTSAALSNVGTIQGQLESSTFSIAFPVNQSYRVQVNATFGYTITSISSRCTSGTCTATFNIGGTNITVTPNAVAVSGDTKTPTALNVVTAGSNLNCVISANSSCQYAIFEIAYTRT